MKGVRVIRKLAVVLVLVLMVGVSLYQDGVRGKRTGADGPLTGIAQEQLREAPLPRITVEGKRVDVVRGSGCWSGERERQCQDTGTPTELAKKISPAIARMGAKVGIQFDYPPQQMGVNEWRMGWALSVRFAGDTTIVLPEHPGVYVYEVYGHWLEGEGSFAFKIEVVQDPPVPQELPKLQRLNYSDTQMEELTQAAGQLKFPLHYPTLANEQSPLIEVKVFDGNLLLDYKYMSVSESREPFVPPIEGVVTPVTTAGGLKGEWVNGKDGKLMHRFFRFEKDGVFIELWDNLYMPEAVVEEIADSFVIFIRGTP